MIEFSLRNNIIITLNPCEELKIKCEIQKSQPAKIKWGSSIYN